MRGLSCDNNKFYRCFIERDSSGRVTADGWIDLPDTAPVPSMMYRPLPVKDLADETTWRRVGFENNPQIEPKIVYDIYLKSLGKNQS